MEHRVYRQGRDGNWLGGCQSMNSLFQVEETYCLLSVVRHLVCDLIRFVPCGDPLGKV